MDGSIITAEDLKAEVKAYNYKALTGGDDAIAVRAIEKATLWAQAKVMAASGSFEADTPINREIVLKRALYELYSYGENEAVAADKKDDALEILRAVYGNAVDAAGYQAAGGGVSQTSLPASSVVKGRISREPRHEDDIHRQV
ncbi:hypothetical protein [Parasphaerochaeta coccoides]|uniref:Uncharacterized protein n=1 Tax=Parasphaerochaeta coccoides (strain ATCC BAA-1237 / DSM 17374 / SPN1) TaxID=760011 RepID=F4GHD8_PARC1|nr:hypothetical protein [Parasphaerochaeta coccoides]AEC02037.1 hypothetical protein Spico_0812 [Parasphaerochaeta coccoides DSM 17374]